MGGILIMDNKTHTSKTITALIIFSILFTNTSCYNKKWGDREYSHQEVDKNKIIGYKHTILMSKSPTISKSKLTFNIRQRPLLQIYDIYKIPELQQISIANRAWIAALGALMVLSGSESLQWLGLGIMLLGTTVGDYDWSFSGLTKEDRIRNPKLAEADYEENLNSSIKITAIINYQSHVYSTTSKGEFSIDLVKDFQLSSFKQPEILKLNITSSNPVINQTFELKSTDWTTPLIKIKNHTVDIENLESDKILILGKAKAGEIYKVLSQTEELIKIQYNNTEGYIPVNSGEVFWSVPLQ